MWFMHAALQAWSFTLCMRCVVLCGPHTHLVDSQVGPEQKDTRQMTAAAVNHQMTMRQQPLFMLLAPATGSCCCCQRYQALGGWPNSLVCVPQPDTAPPKPSSSSSSTHQIGAHSYSCTRSLLPIRREAARGPVSSVTSADTRWGMPPSTRAGPNMRNMCRNTEGTRELREG